VTITSVPKLERLLDAKQEADVKYELRPYLAQHSVKAEADQAYYAALTDDTIRALIDAAKATHDLLSARSRGDEVAGRDAYDRYRAVDAPLFPDEETLSPETPIVPVRDTERVPDDSLGVVQDAQQAGAGQHGCTEPTRCNERDKAECEWCLTPKEADRV